MPVKGRITGSYTRPDISTHAGRPTPRCPHKFVLPSGSKYACSGYANHVGSHKMRKI